MTGQKHGTTTYRRGCRCDECRAAHAAYYRNHYRNGRTTWRGEDLVAEVLTMLERGRSPHDIAAGLGMQLKSIERAFHRQGTPVPWPQTKVRRVA
jgi:DNA-binding phage protein